MAIIEVRNITKTFGSLTVLKDFSVEFTTEGVTVLIGPSGTGKSTLLRCINGLESLDSGNIFVNGLSVRVKKNLQKIRIDCGMVFQQTVLFPHLDVMGNMILSPMKLLNMKRDEVEEKARKMLKRVGLENKEKSRHNELSGGEQQRVAIARALMMDPQALLLDEITSALDPEMSQEVLHILENLAADGVCMIVVTHEMTFARHVASRILFLEGGKLICDKPKEQFFSEERQTNDRVKRFLQFIGETEEKK